MWSQPGPRGWQLIVGAGVTGSAAALTPALTPALVPEVLPASRPFGDGMA